MRNMSLKMFLPLIILLALAVIPIGLAATDDVNDTVTVNVTVAAVAEITVVPEYIEWLGLQPATVGHVNYTDVKNTGSVNITNIYIYASTLTDENERPYGSDNPRKYAAAGLIKVRNETDNIPQFIGRIEWNWTDVIDGADFSAITSPKAWGFYKNTSFEYVWAVGNGTNGLCNGTGAQFAIEDDWDKGTTATRTPTIDGVTWNGGDANFGYFSVSGRAAFGGDNVCVAVAADCSKIYIYKYDKRPGFQTCGNSQYLATRQFAPGDILRITYIAPYVPKGIPAGTLKEGTLTIVASSTL